MNHTTKLATALSMVLLVGTTSCSSGSKKELKGKWEIVKATGFGAEMSEGSIYDFKSDTKLVISKGAIETEGTIVVTDSAFVFSTKGPFGDMDVNYSYRFQGDTLVTTVKDAGQVQHLIRK